MVCWELIRGEMTIRSASKAIFGVIASALCDAASDTGNLQQSAAAKIDDDP